MSDNFIRVNKKLLPLSWIYGAGVGLRNLLFETGVLKSRAYDVPVISVGNITVGGTGKTPHVEYLVRLLKDQMKVAVLSRGYKRKSRGFLMATAETTARQLGDEPYQMKQKFPEVTIAVDRRRTHGIDTLLATAETSDTDVIVLDDAFQHRYVKPGINILLVDYHRNIIHDRLLPAGRLREPLKAKDRADIVIVTKCPADLSPMDYRVLTKQMDLYPYQQLYFTTIDYEPLRPLFPSQAQPEADIDGRHVLLLSGIASPTKLRLDIEKHHTPASLTNMAYADHHNFSSKDIRRINEAFAAMPEPRIIVTTEKDAARLATAEGLADQVRSSLYLLPIRVRFMLGGEQAFSESIIRYIKTNSRNSILASSSQGDSPHASQGRTEGLSPCEPDKPTIISFK
jgi:tetraacyldisaccharide 4'-kinase